MVKVLTGTAADVIVSFPPDTTAVPNPGLSDHFAGFKKLVSSSNC